MTAESDRGYWNRHAQNYGRSMRLLGRPIPRMCELASEAVAGHDRVLEIAAGTGLVTDALARRARRVIATDYAPAMVSMVRGWPACQATAARVFSRWDFSSAFVAPGMRSRSSLFRAFSCIITCWLT